MSKQNIVTDAVTLFNNLISIITGHGGTFKEVSVGFVGEEYKVHRQLKSTKLKPTLNTVHFTVEILRSRHRSGWKKENNGGKEFI